MAKKTNCKVNGKDYFRINRKVGEEMNENGALVSVMKVFYGSCKSEAEEKYQAYMEEQKNAKKAPALLPMRKAIADWQRTFFVNYDLADSTKALYEGAYKRHFEQCDLTKKPLCEVTALDIQEFYNNSNVLYSQLRAINKFLTLFYKHCELNGIVNDIMHPVTVPKKSNDKASAKNNSVEVWDDDDLRKVIDALEGSTLRFLVVLAVNTGARFGELLALTYDDIDGNVLTINKQVTEVPYHDKVGARLSDRQKTQSSNRTLVLSNAVLAELRKHKKIHQAEMLRNGYKTNLIFSSDNGNYYYQGNVKRRLAKIYKKIGVPVHTFHSFRHTYGTNLSRAGVPLEQTSKLMGHSDPSVTQQYYINVSNDDKLKASEKIVQFSLEKQA